MLYEKPAWKENWEETKRHYVQWWNHEGPVLIVWGLPGLNPPRAGARFPDPPRDARQRYTDPAWFARNQRALLAQGPLVADTLPIAHVDYGTVTLAPCFGAEPGFADDTVWYEPCLTRPEEYPPLLLNKNEKWWLSAKQVMLEVLRVSEGDYLVGQPGFGSNLDVLAALRGTQNALMDLIERPAWVKEKLEEIDQSFYTAFDDYSEHIRLADGSTTFSFFQIWGPGKTSQVQCDFSAMISPLMFREFVVPPLQAQCAWLDHSLYHLDGLSALPHLDALLEIPELDAVQWTPGAGELGAGDPKWFDIYRRIRNAGKSVQIMGASVNEARHILDTFGGAGIYLLVVTNSPAEAEEIATLVDSMRPK